MCLRWFPTSSASSNELDESFSVIPVLLDACIYIWDSDLFGRYPVFPGIDISGGMDGFWSTWSGSVEFPRYGNSGLLLHLYSMPFIVKLDALGLCTCLMPIVELQYLLLWRRQGDRDGYHPAVGTSQAYHAVRLGCEGSEWELDFKIDREIQSLQLQFIADCDIKGKTFQGLVAFILPPVWYIT